MKCETCKMNRLCDELERMRKVPKYENCRCYSPIKPITNYERLIRRTPEELARWLNEHQSKARFYGVWSMDAWLEWLKQVIYDLPAIKVNCRAKMDEVE